MSILKVALAKPIVRTNAPFMVLLINPIAVFKNRWHNTRNLSFLENFVRFNSQFLITLVISLGLCVWANPSIYAANSSDQISNHQQLVDTQSSPDANTRNLSATDIEKFATVVAQIHRYYVEPVDNKKLLDYAISGMLGNLDPHSDYLDEDALKDLETATTGKFGGVGIEILPSDGFIKVVSPIDDTPAYKAGIKAGDLIVRINNKLVRDMTLRDAMDKIRGESGTVLHLTILRKNEKKPLEFDVVRQIIKIKTIKTALYPDNYGYIRLSFFQTSTKGDLLKGLKHLQEQAKEPLKGVILDLRNNPGGLLDSAVDVTELFLDKSHLKYGGLIVYTKGQITSSDIKAIANGRDMLKGIPMVVMINEGSASAAEIVAGALQDQKRAILVGQKSFGKGSVQTVLGVDDHSAIKLTTALYYTPSGRSIQATGIEPDISVPDLLIPKTKNQENEDALSVSEADLEKHLASDVTDNMNKTDMDAIDKQNQDLLYSDFSLYQALNILKGLKADRMIPSHGVIL